jgi:hypothetical protein
MPKYPLEPLAALREKKVDEAAHALAAAQQHRQRAEGERHAAELRREGHARAVAAVYEVERAALAEGALRASDLARSDAWALRVAAEGAALARDVGRAAELEAKAQEAEEAARSRASLRQAEAQVVAGHRARWEAEHLRNREARDEEASFEAWRPDR